LKHLGTVVGQQRGGGGSARVGLESGVSVPRQLWTPIAYPRPGTLCLNTS
jgi:hypothetical protein